MRDPEAIIADCNAELEALGCTCTDIELIAWLDDNGIERHTVWHYEGCPVLAHARAGTN